ncbi:MAG: redoxin domain-containing protein [Acetobacteraceae bacterium]|nr:redoxin domain-containing protein [Acetobacteraceae bacterium]
MQLGQIAPDFGQNTTQGRIRFHEWLGDSWGVLFSHPNDFTPVCTTELGEAARLKPEFERRGVKMIGLSVDSPENHHGWEADIARTQGSMGRADALSAIRPLDPAGVAARPPLSTRRGAPIPRPAVRVPRSSGPGSGSRPDPLLP